MALTLAKLQGNLANCSFEYDGETVHLKYRPNVYTPAFLLNLMRLQDTTMSTETLSAIVDLVKQVVADWDVLDEAGAVWPLTEANLQSLPLEFLAAMLRAVTDDVNVGKQTPRLSKKG